jgi:hypothetical protein
MLCYAQHLHIVNPLYNHALGDQFFCDTNKYDSNVYNTFHTNLYKIVAIGKNNLTK